jgi:hypothetical protein
VIKVDGQAVTVSGNTAGVDIVVSVASPAPAITTHNTINKRWFERPIGIVCIGLSVSIAAGGIIYALGWN